MRGLFEKDFRLLCQNRQTLVLFLMMAGFLGLTQNGTFVLGYLSFTFSILLTSTISYDEMDQGFEFLLTLPVTAKNLCKRKVWILHSRCNIFRSIIRNHISDCKRNSWRADPAWGRASDGSDLCTDCLVCDCDYGADTVEIRSGKGKNCNPHGLWWQRISALFCFEMDRGGKRKTNGQTF